MSAATSQPTGRRRTRYRYSPALDGVRGTAMVMFMAFHFGATWLQGAWVGINLFFVLSAFLIVRLLVEERVEWGRIDVLAFYRRRARRLLPALFLLLGSLCVYGLFVAGPVVRASLRSDLIATICYVQNWHLIAIGDQYFATFGTPSFLRHAWTLAVEEQFYVVAPLLVGGVLRLFRSRRVQALALLVLAVVGAVWTAHVGVASPDAQSHAYYGTDTRAQALLIGAALGLWFAPLPNGRGRRPMRASMVAVLGWCGLGSMVYAYLAIAPFARWMFDDGGMYLLAVGSAALVLACADRRPSLLKTVLGWRPFAYLGRRSYGLYLWHWPVKIWLDRAMPDTNGFVIFVIGMVLTTVIAIASYRWLELPVMRGGVAALLPRRRGGRTVTAGVTAVLVAASLVVGNVSPEAVAAHGPTVQLVPGSGPYVPRKTTTRIGIFGDSVPYRLVQWMPKQDYPDLDVSNLADPGCDILLNSSVQWTPQDIAAPGKDCISAHHDLDARLTSHHDEVLTVFGGPTWAMPHKLRSGQVVSLDDASYRAMLTSELDSIHKRALAAGVKQMQLVNVPCRDPNAFFLPDQYRTYLMAHPDIAAAATNPTRLNSFIGRWAKKHRVPVIDLYSQLCPNGIYRPNVNGVHLYDDALHFAPAATRMIWTWLAPRIRATYADRQGVRG